MTLEKNQERNEKKSMNKFSLFVWLSPSLNPRWDSSFFPNDWSGSERQNHWGVSFRTLIFLMYINKKVLWWRFYDDQASKEIENVKDPIVNSFWMCGWQVRALKRQLQFPNTLQFILNRFGNFFLRFCNEEQYIWIWFRDFIVVSVICKYL